MPESMPETVIKAGSTSGSARPTLSEANFDGIVGPTHNYAGLSFGNVASTSNEGSVSDGQARGESEVRTSGGWLLQAEKLPAICGGNFGGNWERPSAKTQYVL